MSFVLRRFLTVAAFFLSLFLCGCKYDDGTYFSHQWVDVSGYDFAVSRNDLSKESCGIIKASVTDSNNVTTINNWVLSRNYTPLTTTGFTAWIKCSSNMFRAGIEMYESGSYDNYWFVVGGDGSFYVYYYSATDKKNYPVISLSSGKSGIVSGQFNKISAVSLMNGDILVLVNDKKAGYIKYENLVFNNFGWITVAYQKKSGVSYSSSNPGNAWFKVTDIQDYTSRAGKWSSGA